MKYDINDGQPWLPFDFILEGKSEPEADYKGIPYFENPKNDEERLLRFQYDYLVKGSEKARGKMWSLALVVAERIVRAEREKKKFFLANEDIYDKAMEALEYVFRRYEKTYQKTKRRKYRKWFVSKSFISVIKCGVLHSLYYGAKKKSGIRIDYYGDLFEELFGKEEESDA